MKKLTIIAALALCFAVGAAALSVAKPPKKKRVTTTATLAAIANSATYDLPDVFFGDLTARKGCKKNRTVELVGTRFVGTSNSNGEFQIVVPNIGPGTYFVRIVRMTRTNKNDVKIICQGTDSNTVTVP